MDGLGLYATGIQGLLFGLALIAVLGGLDDLVIDIAYLIYRFQGRRAAVDWPLREEHLKALTEQPLAVMVPAWQEAGVIAGMLDNLLRSVDYRDYAVFVGVYPNDPETAREVEHIRRRDRRIHIVACPRPGPTSKGDCLNAVYRAARGFGERLHKPFAAYVLHDSEDVVHPLELRLFNAFIPAMDMVQIPVLPLERRFRDFTASHYIDEFAESHVKELAVRAHRTGMVPSAGVGCAFSARALDRMARDNGRDPFRAGSLTEDYDIAVRLGKAGLRQAFVRMVIGRKSRRRREHDPGVIATREFFPHHFWDAVRQKARWQLGITFQGWQTFAWRGDWRQRYALWRDRKGHFAAHVGMLCYFALANTALFHGLRHVFPNAGVPRVLVPHGSVTWWLLLVATLFLISRTLQRAMAVGRHYGRAQALLSIPRQLWGHGINFLAGARALALFVRHKLTGKPLGWDKTSHHFPTASELTPFRRRLGDLLVERKLVARADLDFAASRQGKDDRPLGTILLDEGAVDEDALYDTLAGQHAIRRIDLDPLMVPADILRLVPRSVAIRYSIFPVGLSSDGTLVVATDRIMTSRRRNAIATELGRRLEFRLATRSDLAAAIRWGYEKSSDPLVNETNIRTFKRLIDTSGGSAKNVKDVRKWQRRAYRSLGSILVRDGALSQHALDDAIERMPHGDGPRLGDFLIRQGLVSRAELDGALACQRACFRPVDFPSTPVLAAGE